MSKIKKGRTLGITVDELMDSVRLRIAVDAFRAGDRSFLKAILTELGLEVFLASKSSLTRIVGKAIAPGWVDPETGERRGQGLNQGDVLNFLRSLQISDVLNNLNVHWSLSDAEKELYLGDIKGTLSDEDRTKLLKKVKARFGLE